MDCSVFKYLLYSINKCFNPPQLARAKIGTTASASVTLVPTKLSNAKQDKKQKKQLVTGLLFVFIEKTWLNLDNYSKIVGVQFCR
jgi:hypothetical protein